MKIGIVSDSFDLLAAAVQQACDGDARLDRAAPPIWMLADLDALRFDLHTLRL